MQVDQVTVLDRPQRRLRLGSLRFLTAVIMIIAGLLAMHSFNLEDDVTGTVIPAIAAETAAAGTDTASTAAPAACEELVCGSTHVAGIVTCLLALLTLFLLILPARSGWATLLARTRHLRTALPRRGSVSPWAGPSLIRLSISRT